MDDFNSFLPQQSLEAEDAAAREAARVAAGLRRLHAASSAGDAAAAAEAMAAVFGRAGPRAVGDPAGCMRLVNLLARRASFRIRGGAVRLERLTVYLGDDVLCDFEHEDYEMALVRAVAEVARTGLAGRLADVRDLSSSPLPADSVESCFRPAPRRAPAAARPGAVLRLFGTAFRFLRQA
jgi:hypothetical protein